jgi:hypothetical protein
VKVLVNNGVRIGTILRPNMHIGASCFHDEVLTYKSLFQELCDVFAWIYEEMSGIDPDIVVHEIKTYPDAKPIRQ